MPTKEALLQNLLQEYQPNSNRVLRLNMLEWRKRLSHDTTAELARARLDWAMRERMWDDSSAIVTVPGFMPQDFYDYWQWYAEIRQKEFRIVDTITPWPFAEYRLQHAAMLAYSGGVESLMGARLLYGTDIIQFDAADFDLNARTIEGGLAIIGAALGYANTVIGIEELSFSEKLLTLYGVDKLAVQNNCTDPAAIEQMDEWMHRWCIYAKPAAVQSVVCCWHKDELFAKLAEKGDLQRLRSCDAVTEAGQWCGHCYKCFCIWSIGQARNIPTPFVRLAATILQDYQDEYRQFLLTGYDPYVSLGLYARLHEKFGWNLLLATPDDD